MHQKRIICSEFKPEKTISNSSNFISPTEPPAPEIYSENVEIYEENGNKYIGQTFNGKYNGFGFMRFTNGDTYDGNWKDDKMNGQGIYYFANGDRYVGNWANDDINGKGTYYFANGSSQQGIWKNGVIQK